VHIFATNNICALYLCSVGTVQYTYCIPLLRRGHGQPPFLRSAKPHDGEYNPEDEKRDRGHGEDSRYCTSREESIEKDQEKN
jgi:hypothetical protein